VIELRPYLAAAVVAAFLANAGIASAGDAPPQPPMTPAAAEATLDDTAPDDPEWGETPDDVLQLSLSRAIELGLENNLGVQVRRYGPLIADEEVDIAWGAYDPIWESEIGWRNDHFVNATVFDPNPIIYQKTLDGSGGFVGQLPLLGTEYSAKLYSQRITTSRSTQQLSPEYRSLTEFALRQPFLRDLIWNRPWTQVKVSGIIQASAREQFRLELMNIVAAIIDSYWLLIADHQDLGIARKSLETSQALLEQTRTQYDVGVISRVEVTEAEAGVADREFNLIVAENAFRESQDRLVTLVLGEQLRPASTLAIEPTDRADDYVTYDIDLENATQVAFENRPELILAEQDIERLELEEKFAKNQRLPYLDVIGTYTYEGLSGAQNDDNNPCPFTDPMCADPPFAPTQSYGDSYNNWFDYDGGGSWSIRGFFSIPIPNTTARARATQASIELRQARTQRRRVELDIILEVRTAARNIKSSQEGIEAAERRVAAAAEQLRAEEIRLEYGESTPFDVLLREEDLVEAEGQKTNAYLSYRTSVTALDRRQGTILRNQNIVIDDLLTLP